MSHQAPPKPPTPAARRRRRNLSLFVHVCGPQRGVHPDGFQQQVEAELFSAAAWQSLAADEVPAGHILDFIDGSVVVYRLLPLAEISDALKSFGRERRRHEARVPAFWVGQNFPSGVVLGPGDSRRPPSGR